MQRPGVEPDPPERGAEPVVHALAVPLQHHLALLEHHEGMQVRRFTSAQNGVHPIRHRHDCLLKSAVPAANTRIQPVSS